MHPSRILHFHFHTQKTDPNSRKKERTRRKSGEWNSSIYTENKIIDRNPRLRKVRLTRRLSGMKPQNSHSSCKNLIIFFIFSFSGLSTVSSNNHYGSSHRVTSGSYEQPTVQSKNATPWTSEQTCFHRNTNGWTEGSSQWQRRLLYDEFLQGKLIINFVCLTPYDLNKLKCEIFMSENILRKSRR